MKTKEQILKEEIEKLEKQEDKYELMFLRKEVICVGLIILFGFITGINLVLAVLFGYLLKWLFVLLREEQELEK